MKTGDKVFAAVSLLVSLILAGILIWNQINKSMTVSHESLPIRTEQNTEIVSENTEETETTEETESETGKQILPGIGSRGQKAEPGSQEIMQTEADAETETNMQTAVPILIIEAEEPEISAEKGENGSGEAEEQPEEFLYSIRVNRALNCITIYEKDEAEEYTVPVKAMICSTGGATPLGTFKTKGRYEMKGLNGGVYGQYSTWITGNILFHSVPSSKKTKDSLIARYYNQLGTKASAGCIRLTVADAKWIYDNCPIGTLVEIYDDWNEEGPLGKPEAIKVPLDTVWDPTDPDEANPWKECEPQIEVGSVIRLYKGDDFQIQDYARAYDTCGNEITDRLLVEGNFDLNREGKYRITVRVTDVLEKTAAEQVVLIVREGLPEQLE